MHIIKTSCFILISLNLSYLGLTHSSYKTSLLHFTNGDFNVTGWSKHPERFENVVKGIKNSSLRDSLKTVVVNYITDK